MEIDPDLELEKLQAEMIKKSDTLAPKIIYLLRNCDDLDDPRFNWPEETTWCHDQINTNDVEYIRADLVGITKDRQVLTENQKLAYVSHYGELEAENGRLEGELIHARRDAETHHKMADWRLDVMIDLREKLEASQAENGRLTAELDEARGLLADVLIDHKPTSKTCKCVGIENNCSWHKAFQLVNQEYMKKFGER